MTAATNATIDLTSPDALFRENMRDTQVDIYRFFARLMMLQSVVGIALAVVMARIPQRTALRHRSGVSESHSPPAAGPLVD